MTVQDVAGRAGISRGLLQRIEKGDAKCKIGSAFESKAIVGVTLLKTQSLTAAKLGICIALAAVPFAIIEMEKWLRRG